MIGRACQKPQGCKLIKLKVEFGSKIENVQITGDFFIHPEETIFNIEKSLIGMEVTNLEKETIPRIENAVKNATMIGINNDAIKEILKEAVKNAVESN